MPRNAPSSFALQVMFSSFAFRWVRVILQSFYVSMLAAEWNYLDEIHGNSTAAQSSLTSLVAVVLQGEVTAVHV